MMEYRIASLEEREEFYQKEFDAEKLFSWFKFRPQFYAIDCGSESGVIKFPDKKGRIIMMPPDLSKEDLKKKALKYLPEDFYYDRNVYADPAAWFKRNKFTKFWGVEGFLGQQFCVDVDAENIRKVDSMNKEDYTEVIKEAGRQALEIAEVLRKRWDFKDIGFVYSGRGFHVQTFDEKGIKLKISERNAINDSLKKFAIDRWVSGGHSKLMRLPFSLHGLVSRIVLPLKEDEVESFDPSTDKRTIPEFLR